MPLRDRPDLAATPQRAEWDALADWQAHVDAGRIGVRAPADPAVAANRAATDAIFRRRAAWAAWQDRHGR